MIEDKNKENILYDMVYACMCVCVCLGLAAAHLSAVSSCFV